MLVVTPGLDGRDGVSELTRQWVVALFGMGCRVEVWSLTDLGRPDFLPAAVSFRGAAGSRWRFAALAASASDVDSRTMVAVMHVHLLPALLPLMWRGARLVPVMLGVEVWKPLRLLERFVLRRCWRATAISAHTVARFREEHPVLAGLPVTVCHPRAPDETRADDAVRPGPFALIVGRLSSEERYKGHDALIEIWPRVVGEVPGAVLIVVGDGDDRTRLQARVESAGLRDSILFAGRVPAGRLAALYRDSDFFVMPSRGEGFGFVYLEAMQAGKACIASPGAATEIVEHGVTGLIVDQRDRSALGAAVVQLFSDPALRGRLGAAGAARVDELFSPERLARRLSELLSAPC